MFLHLIIVAALLANGGQPGRTAGSAVAFVHRIPADVQALRLDAPARSRRPAAQRTPTRVAHVASQHELTLTTQLRR